MSAWGLFVLFLLLRDRVAWHVLLPGLAWRAWVLVSTLPVWLALRGEPGDAA